MTIVNNLSFCSSEPCSSPEVGLPPHEGRKPSFLGCSWRRRRRKTKKERRHYHHHHHHHHQEPIMADSISTDLALEEWFAKSPCVENKRICSSSSSNNGEDCGNSKLNSCVSFSGQFSLEELLNSSEFQTSSMEETESDSRDLSLSLEKLLMMREKKKVEVIEVGLYSFIKSNKSLSRERKVSFRLPEASDIIILNSPER